MKAIITQGISGSGKSTWASNLCRKDGNYVNVNRDDIRFGMYGLRCWDDYSFNRNKENFVTQASYKLLEAASEANKNVVVSDTNLSEKTCQKLIQKLTELGYDKISFEKFYVDFDEAVRRDNARANGVGERVIWKQYLKFQGMEGQFYEGNPNAPEAVIFDIDGTLAKMHDRGPFDWGKVGNDHVRDHVKRMLDAEREHGYDIILCSGRDSICRPETEQWLIDHDIVYDALFMRPEGSNEKDTVIKQGFLFNECSNWNVVRVYDDRPCVLKMWLSLGLDVVSVGDPYFEF